MIDLIVHSVLPAALSMLPPAMDSKAARAHLVAIGLQESKFLSRRQILNNGNPGPASGFWQFERGGGVTAVLEHQKTRDLALAVLRRMRYVKGPNPGRVIISTQIIHAKLEDNDLLAAVFARLLLFQVPARLPQRSEPSEAWRQYLEGWRPGKPHPDTWAAYYAEAWARIETAHGNLPAGETP